MTNKEAIEVLTEELKSINPNDLGRDDTFAYAKSLELAIKALAERPHGEWLVVGHDDTTYWYRCSICEYTEHDNFTKHHHFCPSCGADMQGGRE